MAIPAMITGLLLIVIGVVGYAGQEGEKASPTALIPAVFGAIIALCGVVVVFKESLRKHAMHLAAAVALIGMLGAPYPIFKRAFKGSPIDASEPAVVSAALTTLILAVFLAMCVRSFAAARRARQQQDAAQPAS